MEAGKERLTRDTVRDATRQEIDELKRESTDLKHAPGLVFHLGQDNSFVPGTHAPSPLWPNGGIEIKRAGQLFAIALFAGWGYVIASKASLDISWLIQHNPYGFWKAFIRYILANLGG